MKYTAIALVTFGMLFNGAFADEADLKEAKAKLAQAREKYEKSEEAEAIDIAREAARLGSVDAQEQLAEWLLDRSLPKDTPLKSSKALKEAEKSEQTVINILEQEIAALLQQCQQSQSEGEMSEEQLQLMMMLMQMAGMKPGDKPGPPGPGQGNTPGQSTAGGNTDKLNEAIPGSLNGAKGKERKIQKLAGRTSQLPKEFQPQLKEFFKGIDKLRKDK